MPSIPALDTLDYPSRPPLTVATADLLRLALPGGPRPHDAAVTEIRAYVADRHDGLPRRGHHETEALYAELDGAIVDAVTAIHPVIPTTVMGPDDIAAWVERIGMTITLPPALADAVANHQDDDDDHEEYRPRWIDRALRKYR